MNRSILIDRLCHHIVKINQHIAVIIHRLCDLVKFIDSCHPLFESGSCAVISHKSTFRIYYQ